MLLDAGTDLNCRDDEDYTPSSWAVLQGRANVLAFLLDMGASMDIKLPDEDTPLCFAAGMGYEKLVKLLLERNAAVDGVTDGRPGTPLFRAAQAGHMKIASQLLEAGADIRYMSYGQNSLHWAAHGGYEDVVTLLLENGAVATETDIAGNTPLRRACYSGSMNERVVELLLKENVNVNARNSDGSTPL
jgi:ankyrin repeat protein